MVRDSTSYRGSFGLAMKVDQMSANFATTAYPGKLLLLTVQRPDLMAPFESCAIIKSHCSFRSDAGKGRTQLPQLPTNNVNSLAQCCCRHSSILKN